MLPYMAKEILQLWWFLNEEITLDYLGGPNTITGVFISERRRQEKNHGRCDNGSRVRVIILLVGRGPRAKACRQPLENGNGNESDSPLEPLEKKNSPTNTLTLVLRDLFLDFQNCKIINLCCFKSLFVVTCYSRNRTLIQTPLIIHFPLLNP